MKSPVFSLQQLRERGWTPAIIRTFLGAPDEEDPNQGPPGTLLQTFDDPVEFYLEARVLEAEARESFAEIQTRAQQHQAALQKAVQIWQQLQADRMARHAELPLPTLIPPPAAETWTPERLWKYRLRDYNHWCRLNDHLLSNLPRALKQQANRYAFERYRSAFQAFYRERGLPL